ncbi:MAG: hypothetical protein LBT18_01030 [Endomicrobium sp.]|jgi:hypothetical protein|nr:hypothetical protein [Endomicrobium sp.]
MKKITLILSFLMLYPIVSFANNYALSSYYGRYCDRTYPLDCYWGYGPRYYYYPDIYYGIFYYDYNRYYNYEYYRRKYNVAFNEIELLEKRKEESESVKKEISKIKILNARFYKQYTSDTLPISTAELIIENRSEYSITKIFFKGKLTTHITDKVLINDTFNYDLPFVLESGEKNTYNIPLNSFGQWSRVNPPDLAVFDVVIEEIETADGKNFVISFSSEDKKNLDKLRKKYI